MLRIGTLIQRKYWIRIWTCVVCPLYFTFQVQGESKFSIPRISTNWLSWVNRATFASNTQYFCKCVRNAGSYAVEYIFFLHNNTGRIRRDKGFWHLGQGQVGKQKKVHGVTWNGSAIYKLEAHQLGSRSLYSSSNFNRLVSVLTFQYFALSFSQVIENHYYPQEAPLYTVCPRTVG